LRLKHGTAQPLIMERFKTIVVPLDVEHDHAVALDEAAALAAAAGLDIQLVSVSSGPQEEPDRARLHQAGSQHHLERWEDVVLHGSHVAEAIAVHLTTVEGPLVVMASSVHGPLGELLSLSTVSEVLTEVDCPVLIVGPHVADRPRLPPRLIICVAPTSHADTIVPEVARWQNTFGGEPPWVVEVVDPGSSERATRDVPDTAVVQRFAEQLAASGIRSEWEVLHDDDPVEGVIRFTEPIEDAVLLVASERWSDPVRTHLHSVSRRIAHRSAKPVLVIPTAKSAS
jgi:nucleotide-binding universal stress UspA family protein